MTGDVFLKVRVRKESRIAFRSWLAKCQKESGDDKLDQGDAFDELLRRVGELPPKARSYA